MKQKQRIALFGMVAVALILAACDGDSGNNGTETEGDGSSSSGIYSSGGQMNSSPAAHSYSSSAGVSGSSVVVSSSGAKAQSSSSVTASVVDPSTVISGTMTDFRDSRIYKTVKIGTQTWMAQNLNYADSAAMTNLAGNSWCYNNRTDSCAKYGRLYTWTGAMNIDSSYLSTIASAVVSPPQQGVCPTGWHVPSSREWKTLETAVGGWSTAGTALKSTSGWYNDGNGTDAYGFSGLPAGSRYYSVGFADAGNDAYFWSATEDGAKYAYFRNFYYDGAYISVGGGRKYSAYSVRCLKN